MARRKAPHIAHELLDQLLFGTHAATAPQQGDTLDELKKAFADRALDAERDHHLGGELGAGNSRNGYGRKTVLTDTDGRIALEVPRDRQAAPQVADEALDHSLPAQSVRVGTAAAGSRNARRSRGNRMAAVLPRAFMVAPQRHGAVVQRRCGHWNKGCCTLGV